MYFYYIEPVYILCDSNHIQEYPNIPAYNRELFLLAQPLAFIA